MNTKVSQGLKLAVVVFLTSVLLYLGGRALGIDMGDETMYLHSASSLQAGAFVWHQSWSPLYMLWFKLLSYLCPDPLTRYFLSWRFDGGVSRLPAAASQDPRGVAVYRSSGCASSYGNRAICVPLRSLVSALRHVPASALAGANCL